VDELNKGTEFFFLTLPRGVEGAELLLVGEGFGVFFRLLAPVEYDFLVVVIFLFVLDDE
jgi:hypothetical protein